MKIRLKDILFIILVTIVAIFSLIKLNSALNLNKLGANVNIDDVKYEVLRTYELGDIVYFDPVNYEICDENSTSETCYSWNVFSKNNNKYSLYLKGIYDSMRWTQANPVDIIKTYTENWSDNLTIDSSYDITINEDYGYKFSETKARIITKSEYEHFVDKNTIIKPYNQGERYKYLILDTENGYVDHFGYNGQYATDIGTFFDFATNAQGAYINEAIVRPLINIDLEDVGNSTTYEYLAEFMAGNVVWESQRLGSNKKISKPLNPTKEGYKFVKWVKENGEEFNFNEPISKSIRLYAEYEEMPNTLRVINKYDTVDFDPVNYRFCDEDYDSPTCYSWVVINKDGNEYDLYSRVVTPNMSFNTSNIVDIINSYTQNWDNRLKVDPSYNISYSYNYGNENINLNINFSETKARLLTREEYDVGVYQDKIAQRNLRVTVVDKDYVSPSDTRIKGYIAYSAVDTNNYTGNHSSKNYDLIYSASFYQMAKNNYNDDHVYAVPVIHINLENVGNNKEKDRPNYTCRRATKNITLGQMNTKGTLRSGDVFDCDVDGTGYTERFYYVTDLEENTDYGVLLYSHNVRNGKIYNYIGYHDLDVGQDRSNFQYDKMNMPAVNGPVTARIQLPPKELWTNIRLYNEKRDIYDPANVLRVENFSYEYWAARLLTYKEALSACGVEYEPKYTSHSINLNPGCEYLTDNLLAHYSDRDTDEFLQRGLPYMTKPNNPPHKNWLETPMVSMYLDGDIPVFTGTQGVVLLDGGGPSNKSIYAYTSSSTDESAHGIKPAIEVRKALLNYGATIKVTYNDEGRIEEAVIAKGSKATSIDSKGKEYYKFKYWSQTRNGERFNFDTVLEDDITLYAVYELENYTINYNLDGGTLETGKTNPVSYTVETDTFTLFNPVKEHYKFIGWSGTGLTGNDNKVVTIENGSSGNREYTANFEIDKFDVEFFDGEELKIKQVIPYNEKINQEEVPNVSKYGYHFDGWAEDEFGEIFDLETPITKSYRLYSRYTIEKYNIEYDLSEGTLETGEINPVNYTVETDTFTLNNPVKDHYKFIGWSGTGLTGNDNKTVTIEKGSSGNREYTANFEIDKFDVEFYRDEEKLDTQVIEYNKKINKEIIPKVEKTGYTFIGWRENNSLENFDLDKPITKSYKLYAIFKGKEECKLSITSKIYKVDEEKQEINNVPENEEINVIQSNLIIEGTIREITRDNVIIACDDKVKVYKINRIWIPKTGNILTRGMIIIGYLGIVLTLLFVIGKQVDINKRLRRRL